MVSYSTISQGNDEVFAILGPIMAALCISIYKPGASGFYKLLNIIYPLIILSWYLLQILFSLSLVPSWSFSPQIASVAFQKICEIVMPILVIVQAFYDNDKYIKSCAADVDFTDKLLYATAIEFDYKKLKDTVRLTFISTTVYLLSLITFGTWFLLGLIKSLSPFTVLAITVVEFSHILYSVYFNYFFCIILLVFKMRFQRLNEEVKMMKKPKWEFGRKVINVKPFKDVSGSKNEVLEKIKTIKFVHAIYRELMMNHNNRFGIPLLLQFTQNLIVLTLCVYSLLYMIYNFDKVTDFTFTRAAVVASVRSVTMIGSTIFFCSLCSSEANNMKHVVHELMGEIEDKMVLKELEDFSLELIHGSLFFTACNFYAIDYSLITKIVGSVASYVIILMQFGSNDYQNILTLPQNQTRF